MAKTLINIMNNDEYSLIMQSEHGDKYFSLWKSDENGIFHEVAVFPVDEVNMSVFKEEVTK